MSVIGDTIRALREFHGLTQQQLADNTGVTRETVNKWETGSIGNVRTSNIEALREHFSLSVDDLRSESCGLAAKARRKSERADAPAFIPLMGSSDSQLIELPATILRNHPNALAYRMPDASMSRVLPAGCDAIIDPDATPRAASVVLADVPGAASPVLRRLHAGSTKVLLSTDSYERHDEDMVVGLDDLELRGVMVWYQAPTELA